MDDNVKDAIKVVIFTVILLGSIILMNCNGGWSIGSLEISPADSVEIDYLVIIDQDSSKHWYKPNIEIGENYCYKHHIWEDVRRKSE